MTVTSKRKAWQAPDEIFPTDYMKDDQRSERAGYPVYYSTLEGCTAYICDLGDRLEVNLPDGHTVNIWIDETVDITPDEILSAAWFTFLDRWVRARERFEGSRNAITEAREIKARKRLNAIEDIIRGRKTEQER